MILFKVKRQGKNYQGMIGIERICDINKEIVITPGNCECNYLPIIQAQLRKKVNMIHSIINDLAISDCQSQRFCQKISFHVYLTSPQVIQSANSWSTLVEGGKERYRPPGKLTLELVLANQNKINFKCLWTIQLTKWAGKVPYVLLLKCSMANFFFNFYLTEIVFCSRPIRCL